MRFLYLLLFIPFTLLAQLPKGWQELTISDGLSQGMVFDLTQDKQGFIWVATKDGLNRYDGHNFTVFTHNSANEYSLSDDNCSSLLVDSRGWLWVGTLNKGLDLFDTRTQRFYHFTIRGQASANTANYGINALTEDPQGNIWVTANLDKLFKISLSEGLKTKFPSSSSLQDQIQIVQAPIYPGASQAINHISFRADGQAWAICNKGVSVFNWKTPEKAGTFSPFDGAVTAAYAGYSDINHNSWFATSGNKVYYSRNGRVKTIPVAKKTAFEITLKSINTTTLAIATDEFLWLMSPDELGRQDSLTARNAFSAFPTNLYAISDILADRTGNIWLGTSGYGIRKFNPKIKQFHSSLPDKTLSYIYADQQGRIYVRHEFAYEQLDRSGNRLQPFLPDKLSVADKRQRYLMQDRQGTFWVSNVNFETHVMHLYKFSTDWKLLKKYPLPPNTSFGFFTNQTVEDKAGNLWIAAINGHLLRFDPQTETFRLFSYQTLLPQKGADIETKALYFDRTGTLWIGTMQGLIRALHPETTPAFSIYKNNPANPQSLSTNFILSLLDDPYQADRYLWVGTKGGGLDRLDKQTGNFIHITEAQGLPNKVVYGILADEVKNLWLSTNRGLAQFNPKTQAFRSFTKEDGLQDDEFNTGSYVKTPSGQLLFGGVHGLTAFWPPDVVRAEGAAPPAHVVGLKINNEPVRAGSPDGILTEGIEHTNRIDLSHSQNLLTLEFGVMDFANSAKNKYRYRLEGIDHEWVEAGTNRFANYAQLPDGRYTLQMMGSPDGEVWSKPVELAIWVHPPVYRTWWAYLIYTIGLVFIGWQLYRFQTQRLLLQQQVAFEQQEASRLAELDTLKTQFFTNISHEFRTPLTLLMGPIPELRSRFPNEAVLDLMERNGQRLLSLISQLLDLSKLEAGQLRAEPEPGDMANFFRIMASSFTSLADSRGISFSFTQTEASVWGRFDRDKLEQIVTNLLSNAFKFTPAGRAVRMQVRYEGEPGIDQVRLEITDEGIGIAPDKLSRIFERFYQVDSRANRAYEGTGIGLALVKELVQVLGGTITVQSADGAGTTFELVLPVQPSERYAEADQQDLTAERPAPQVIPPYQSVELSGETADHTTAKTLLLIDDNADIRAYVRSIFQGEYQILEAEDGLDGLGKATDQLPDLVICDLMMPRLDGFGFCRALKTQDATSHIPVVMLTARATLEDRIEGFELGADEYLTKPFNRLEIQVRVRNLLAQRTRLAQYFSRGASQPGTLPPTLIVREDTFLKKVRSVVHQHLADSQFGVDELSEALHLSSRQLVRKLKALTDQTAVEFIRTLRLDRAAELLLKSDATVSEVAYAVGFESLPYFSKVFQEKFGVVPSQYAQRKTTI